MKTCTKCKEQKLVSEFYKSKTGKNGLMSNCKKCTSTRKRAVLLLKNPNAIQMKNVRSNGRKYLRNNLGQKECFSCKQWLPESFFGKDSRSLDGLNGGCTRCISDIPHKLSVEQRNAMLSDQQNCCAGPGCNFKFDLYGGLGKTYYVDHDHNCCSGSNSCGKCIRGLLCASCNRVAMSATHHIAWLNYCMKYEMEKAK